MCVQSIRRASGPLWTIRASQRSALYASVGPPSHHQPGTRATSFSTPDGVRQSGVYDMPADVHVDVGGAPGRDSNVYEVPHDVLEAASQSGDSRSNSRYDTVIHIRARLMSQRTRQFEDSAISMSSLQDSEGTGGDALVARGYETPQSARERYSHELEDLAQSDAQDDDSTGYEVRHTCGNTGGQSLWLARSIPPSCLCSGQLTSKAPCLCRC